MRILFCGTYPGIISGYAKISASIVNFLVQYHDVYHVAFQAKDETQRYVDPRIKLIDQRFVSTRKSAHTPTYIYLFCYPE